MAKPTIEEIRKYKQELVGKDGSGGFYSNLRNEQRTDQEYYDDNFGTSIKAPYHVIRTGSSKRICDSVTWHINTSNPQAFREPRKAGEAEEKKAAKVTKLLNYRLFYLIEEIQEASKKANKRGEAFFQLKFTQERHALPSIIAPDPMIIYPDPSESNGVPSQCIKACRMTVSQVEQIYPNFANPKNRKLNAIDGVEYWAWWNDDWYYVEADGQPLLEGEIQPNVLGRVPFSHCYSSYGEKSPEGKPETKAVGLLRPLRGTLREECELTSRLDSIVGLMANPILVLMPQAENAGEIDAKEVQLSPGRTIKLPFGWTYEIKGMDAAVIQPLLYQLAQVKQSLGVEVPPIAMGLPSTSRATGRQEDIYGEHYRKRFDKLIDNLERALATILSMELEYLYKIPQALPITIRATVMKDGKQVREEETITKDDIDGYYECQVKLKATDVVESDKQFMMFRMLATEGHIDWETYLTEGLGWTADKARRVITKARVEQAYSSNPMLANLAFRDALEEAGRGKVLRQLDEMSRQQAMQQQALTMAPQGQPRPSEATNPLAYETIRQMLYERPYGARESGAGYMQRG